MNKFKILQDLEAKCTNGKLFSKFVLIVFDHTFHLTIFIRLGCFLNKLPVIGRIFSFFIEYIIRVVYASDISCKATLGAGLNIIHGHDIVIGSEVVIGENVKIFNGVTLGNKNTETLVLEQPEVGNNVVIGTGAKLLGSIHIGNNVKIGANSVVLCDIPENTVWAGVPAVKLKDNMEIGL